MIQDEERESNNGDQLQGAHFPQDIILMGIRWYLAYPLSYRHVEELLEERGVPIDHATIQRWVVKYSPQLEEAFHRRKRAVWVSWRMDETYIKVKGQWRYLYRAVDKTGQTIDFLLTEDRDEQAAKRFLTKAIRRHGVPERSTDRWSARCASAALPSMVIFSGTPWRRIALVRNRLAACSSTVLCEEKVDRLARFIDGAIEIAPLALDLDIGLVHPPTDPHGTLPTVERLFQLGLYFTTQRWIVAWSIGTPRSSRSSSTWR